MKLTRYLRKSFFDAEYLGSKTKFYIASYSDEVLKYLHSKYDDRIISGDWELSHKTVKGIQDAVNKLHSLESTQEIIGRKGSTYLTMASMLYGIPVVYD